MGTLLSVNVGMPKELTWQGKTVYTGVFKQPVTGPCRVRKLNVDGDGQGDLPVTVASSAPSCLPDRLYRYWERELAAMISSTGSLRELTVEGLADSDVCIGDRYQIGRRCSKSRNRGLRATVSAFVCATRAYPRYWCHTAPARFLLSCHSRG